MESKGKSPALNKLKNRLLILSPTVKEGLEPECKSTDFFRDQNKSVGKGAFGEVWKVTHKVTNVSYVIKVIDKAYIIDQKMVAQINREIEIMYKIDHPHLVKLVNHFEDDANFYLIMHFASKGQLYKLLNKVTRFDQRTAAQYIREMIEAVKYLHSFDPPIIHRDIKPENILLDENNRVKLADFGWSNFEDGSEDRKTYCGTPDYLSPEMVKREGHGTSVDVWSLGVLLFELLAGYAPFAGHSQEEKFSNIKRLKINWPNDFPPIAKNLVSKILKLNPKERLTLDEILAHSWFEKNPPLRPVLVKVPVDRKKLLESHLVSIKPENISDEINNVVSNSEKKRISNIVEKARQENQNQDPSTENMRSIIQQLQNDNEKLSKENAEIRTRCEKVENELKTQKAESIKRKDSATSHITTEEINKLREEIERYKVINKERLNLLSEIEEKNSDITDLKNNISNINTELLNLTKTNAQLTEKGKEQARIIENSEYKITELKAKLNELMKEKEDIQNQYQKKVEILQNKLLDSTSEDTDNPNNNLIKVVEMLNDSLDEYKLIFKSKTSNLSTMLEEIKDQCSKTEMALSGQIKEKSDYVVESINKMRYSITEDINKSGLRFTNSNSANGKTNEMVEWLKKQISELQPYKNKATANEIRITNLEQTVKTISRNWELANEKANNLERIANLKDTKIVEMQAYIDNLEAKLSDVKDFVFKNCFEQLDHFNSCFKNYYKV